MPSAHYLTIGGVTRVTTSSVTITPDAHAGHKIVFDRAAGVTATLPAATGSGVEYEFIFAADASGGNYVIQVANSTDVMAGVAHIGNDSAGVSTFYTADTSDTVTMNGTTQGGRAGARVNLVDIKAGIWSVMIFGEGSGTEATPFSAAV